MLAKKLIAFVANLSLRVWLLIAGLLLALMPASFSQWTTPVNYPLFVGSSFLVEAPKGGANFGLIKVPDSELRSWQQDINSAGKLGALLANILHSSDATVGVLLPGTFDLKEGVADELLARIADSSRRAELIEEAEALVERKKLLLDTLRNERVVVGSYLGLRSDQQPIPMQPGVLDKLSPTALRWLWPQSWVSSPVDETHLPQPGLDHFPVFPWSYSKCQLVIYQGAELAYGDFLSHYLFAVAKSGGKASENNPWSFFWQRDRGLTLGDQLIPTSPQGTLYTFNDASQRLTPLFNVMSLEEGLARGAFPDYVLIAGESSQHLSDIASSVFSLLNGNYAYTPWWFIPVSSGVFVLFSLIIAFLIPRLSFTSGILSVAILVLIALVCQLVLAASKGLWLPLAGHLCYLLLGFAAIRLWCRQRDSWQQMQARVDEAGVYLAGELLDSGQLDEVRPVLDGCSADKDVLQKYYDLGGVYAGKRQYRSAIETLQHLQSRSRGFRDTEQKIQTLQNMLAASAAQTLHDVVNVESTVVLDPADMVKPVLGRYEIRRELGRGAMGIVYLGFDPRIAREVAIKTLNYSQFQANQLDNIKARFFREAEAAGRLNHPHIVSVYDVGEERDLAYIAMDYVEGKSLSAFVDEHNLLPPFEVYRIMADVAAALEYAHGNHIVHRDIKPGNIMYNPAPYQVKVTDFGIARLVDDSKTSTGEILGSPLYMSPEQLKGKRVNHSADIFSLGVTFYQLLCGRLPFAGENLASLTYEIIHGKHKGVRTIRKDLPTSASRITNQCLQKDAADRYETAGELAMVLRKTIRRDFAHEAKKTGYL